MASGLTKLGLAVAPSTVWEILRTAVQAPRMNATCKHLVGTYAASSWIAS